MGSKSLIVLAIVLVIAVAVFVSNTTSLLDPILERLSLREPEDTHIAVLRVDGYLDEANSPEGYYTIAYSVSNLGNATAQNVTLTTAVDGETQDKLIQSLSVSDTANYYRVVSTVIDELHVVQVQASCEDSADFYSFSFGADVLRSFSDKPELVKLFVTPREPSLVALKDELIEEGLINVKDWIALRNWVGNNIQYEHDDDVHGVRDYWQFGEETVALKTGDCEDFSILLCSLLRAAGYSPDDVYIVIGKNQNGYHAWVKINLGSLGWYNLEPQENGFATLVGDFLTLSDYQAIYEFNDQQFHQIS
ncbi:transglutaminase domain-containing protein [Candidatus Bathyarchaeota archaeon]|nr:transglutaminase domain-containing protein [Candidatus Bathyarchaeota archaeon]